MLHWLPHDFGVSLRVVLAPLIAHSTAVVPFLAKRTQLYGVAICPAHSISCDCSKTIKAILFPFARNWSGCVYDPVLADGKFAEGFWKRLFPCPKPPKGDKSGESPFSPLTFHSV